MRWLPPEEFETPGGVAGGAGGAPHLEAEHGRAKTRRYQAESDLDLACDPVRDGVTNFRQPRTGPEETLARAPSTGRSQLST